MNTIRILKKNTFIFSTLLFVMLIFGSIKNVFTSEVGNLLSIAILVASLAIFALKLLMQKEIKLSVKVLFLLILILCFIPSLAKTDISNFYANEKVTKFFFYTSTIILIPIMLPSSYLFSILVNTMKLFMILALFICINFTFYSSLDQFSILKSNPITTSMLTVLCMLSWIYFFCPKNKFYFVVKIGVITLLSVSLIASGSRGALFLFLLILPISYYIFGKPINRLFTLLLIPLLIALFAYSLPEVFKLNLVPLSSQLRVQSFLQGEFGESELSRLKAIEIGLNYQWQTLFGHGFGAFSQINDDSAKELKYPHNIVLECIFEYGLQVFILFFMFFLYSLRKLYSLYLREEKNLELRTFKFLLTSIVFLFLLALTTGDINDHRILYYFMAITVSLNVNCHSLIKRSNSFKYEQYPYLPK